MAVSGVRKNAQEHGITGNTIRKYIQWTMMFVLLVQTINYDLFSKGAPVEDNAQLRSYFYVTWIVYALTVLLSANQRELLESFSLP
eukprot:CAMPEP_0114973916 /NCGR_PEP_ID=MMETSP0216-20121206/1230_1 /TAXON_ID=223996 /ORGANISM="Protocruzia adherens, Strain Boccale" /LENGTH=85 /DNA_ID=CAMNT_0002334481 /DNA_START=666 /DNA_END=920 /DNA_ORIENTATION=-